MNLKDSAKPFIIRFLTHPTSLGSLVLSSDHLGRAFGEIANQFPKNEIIVELGALTGAVTQYLPEKTISIEIDTAFYSLLKTRFANRKILNMDANDYLKTVTQPIRIIFTIPLVNNPNASQFLRNIRQNYADGLICSLSTFTYGCASPFKELGFQSERKVTTIYRNLPPAHIWHYSS